MKEIKEGHKRLPSGAILSFGANVIGEQVYSIIKIVEGHPVYLRPATREEIGMLERG